MSVCFFARDPHVVIDALGGGDEFIEATTTNGHMYHKKQLNNGRAILVFLVASRFWLPYFQSIIKEFEPETVVLCGTRDVADFATGDVLFAQSHNQQRLISETDERALISLHQNLSHSAEFAVLSLPTLCREMLETIGACEYGLTGKELRAKFHHISNGRYALAVATLREKDQITLCETSRRFCVSPPTAPTSATTAVGKRPSASKVARLHFCRLLTDEKPRFPLDVVDEAASHLFLASNSTGCRLLYCQAVVKEEDEKDCASDLTRLAAKLVYTQFFEK